MSDEADCPQLDRFYHLLPAIIRRRDEQEGRPLRALLRVITREAGYVEADIARLYNNCFIETCDDWAVPYLGDLLAYPLGGAEAAANGRGRIGSPRRQLAKAISYRRRGGTLGLLEELAWDITGWPARALEYDALVAATPDLRLPPSTTASAAVNVRNVQELRRIRGPFETTPHLVDVRRLGSTRNPGRYRPETVALFVWRTAVRSVSLAAPKPIDTQAPGDNGRRFTFDPLGRDIPLYVRPDYQPGKLSGSGIDPEIGFPVPLAPHHFHELLPDGNFPAGASIDVYGPDRSLAIYAQWDKNSPPTPSFVPAEQVCFMDLKQWPATVDGEQIGVDPVRGRMVFPPHLNPVRLLVSYHHAAPCGIGAGRSAQIGPADYGPSAPSSLSQTVANHRVSQLDLSLAQAISAWSDNPPPSAVIEITDSGTYELAAENKSNIHLQNQRRLEIRAARDCRPVIRFAAGPGNESAPWRITAGPAGGHLVLSGLLISATIAIAPSPESGAALTDNAGELTLRGCTILPAPAPGETSRQDHRSSSIWIERGVRKVTVQNSITGRINLGLPWPADKADEHPEKFCEPTQLVIADSIIDAMPLPVARQAAPRDRGDAIKAHHAPPSVELDIRRATVFGTVHVSLLKLAENVIFTGPILVDHRQEGGMRYCHVPRGSTTPRRYQCQPDLSGPLASPRFISTLCADPGYAMLDSRCPPEITQGADDDGEIGALHDAFDFRRLSNLASRVAEFIPARFEARVILLSPGNEHELRS